MYKQHRTFHKIAKLFIDAVTKSQTLAGNRWSSANIHCTDGAARFTSFDVHAWLHVQ